MIVVAIAAVSAVTVTSAPLSIPVFARMPGFTARMYAMAANVVRPACISRATDVRFSSSLKSDRSMKSGMRTDTKGRREKGGVAGVLRGTQRERWQIQQKIYGKQACRARG